MNLFGCEGSTRHEARTGLRGSIGLIWVSLFGKDTFVFAALTGQHAGALLGAPEIGVPMLGVL